MSAIAERKLLFVIVGFLGLAVMYVGSLSFGGGGPELLSALKATIGLSDHLPSHHRTILYDIRLPRFLMACLAGAALAVSGVTIQVLVRNPMADPWILGVSSGSSLGAVVAITVGIASLGQIFLHLSAFSGAAVASLLVYIFAKKQNAINPTRTILAGMALSFIFGSMTQFAIFSAKHAAQTRSLLFWTLGSLGNAEMDQLVIPTIALFLGTLVLLGYSKADESSAAGG